MRFLLSAFFLFLSTVAFSQKISGVNFRIVDNRFVITYAMSGYSSDIQLFISTDGGKHYSAAPLTEASGSIGAVSSHDNSRQSIYWSPFERYKIGLFADVAFKVVDDESDTSAESEPRRVSMPILFTDYAKLFVVPEINKWQQRGRYETMEIWKQRVNQDTRKARIDSLVKVSEKNYIRDLSSASPSLPFLRDYDPDRGVFLLGDATYGDMLVEVPVIDANLFESKWKEGKVDREVTYMVDNDRLAVAKIDFKVSRKKRFTYNSAASLAYKKTEINYDFAPIEITYANNNRHGNQDISSESLSVGRSDVDVNIPKVKVDNQNTFVVIVANENYMNLSRVEFALNDSKVFREYCEKTLGIPSQNIRYYANATYGMMHNAMSDLRNITEAYGKDSRVIIYYAGHGAPEETTKSAYLIPVDAYGVQPSTCYALKDFYEDLSHLSAKSVVVFMDACFSGASRSGEMLASARGVAIAAKKDRPQGNVLVFSAASMDETAMPYRDKGHGLFTYFLLKKLQESEGKLSFGDLAEYLKRNVRLKSNIVNKKNQTPTVSMGSSLQETWETMELR